MVLGFSFEHVCGLVRVVRVWSCSLCHTVRKMSGFQFWLDEGLISQRVGRLEASCAQRPIHRAVGQLT